MRASLVALLLLSPAIAVAQPEPPPPPPTEPPAEPAPAEPVAEPLPIEPPAEPAPEPAKAEKPAVTLKYDKGTVLASEDGAFQMKLSLRTQFRLESTRPTEEDSEFSTRIYIPRARLQLEGHVFGEDTRYKLEFAFGDRGSFAFVKDLFIERKLAAAPIWARVGQWKRPFNRQELVSDFASELNERAITAEFVGGGRDLGIALHNDYEKSPDGLEWALGVFNDFSGGDDRPVIRTECEVAGPVVDCTTPAPSNFPDDFKPAAVARVGWNQGGIKGYSEGDLEGGPLRFAVGVSYKVDLAGLDSDAMQHGVEADAMIKVEGIGVELGAYMMKAAGDDVDPTFGALVQAGYFVMPKQAQVVGRFAFHDSDEPGQEHERELEGRAGFNWYWQGHAWKLATDAGVLDRTGDEDEPDVQVRVMAQLQI